LGFTLKTCRSRLAGDGGLADAFAGKPGSYKIAGEFGTEVHAKPVGARLAGDGGLADAFAGKPGSYNIAGEDSGLGFTLKTCRSRLAGDGDFTGAFAGKPDSYKIAGDSGLRFTPNL
jgi:hypothetical protein